MPSILEQMLLLPSGLLAMSVSHALSVELEERKQTLPAPVSFPADQSWDGIDGSWSTFILRVGTPEQVVRTLVSFQSYQTLVIGPQGCQTAADVEACTQQRGGTYDNQTSSTANDIGIFDILVDTDLGLDSNAMYFYETVGLALDGQNGPTLQNTTLGQMAADAFYLGFFGLNPVPTNWTSYSAGAPSYMTLLKQHGHIPSVSAGYTAGAQYRSTGEPASLTLGGYDSSKIISNDVEFSFAADNEKFLMVGLQSITTPSSVSSSPVATELLPGGIYALLDTTVAEIWLPLQACLAFEEVFGLEYDNTTQLYLVNQTLHDKLKASSPTLNFTLGQDATGGPTVQIGLPYSAFDLSAKPPYQGLLNDSYYFPLRRAANDSQYTIGRAFFQEAYLSVDWESQSFNVSQCNWNGTSSQSIVTIPPSEQTTAAGTIPGTTGLSRGAIAGIVVGAFAILVLVALFVLWIFRHRKKVTHKNVENEKLGHLDHVDSIPSEGTAATVFPKAELEGSLPIPRRNPRRSRGTDQQDLLAAGNSTGTGSPNTSQPPSSIGYSSRSNGRDSPSTPVGGDGTHSLTQTGSQVGTSILSPGSAGDSSEAEDSRGGPVFEMAGDMPSVKEKDGRALSEKEAMIRRERMYNGVGQPLQKPQPVAKGLRRQSLGKPSPADAAPLGRARKTASGKTLRSPVSPTTGRLSPDGDRRSVSGMALGRASPNSDRRSINGSELTSPINTKSRLSTSRERQSVDGIAMGRASSSGKRGSISGSELTSPVSPTGRASPSWDRRSMNGNMLSGRTSPAEASLMSRDWRNANEGALVSPISPIAEEPTTRGRDFLPLHRSFSFEISDSGGDAGR